MPHLEDTSLGPALDFMRLMWAINHGLDRTSRSMHALHGVTGPQRLVLRILDVFPGLSAGDLARTLHMHPSTLTGVLRRLEARRLLRRTPDPTDGRRAHLSLTAAGRRLTSPEVGAVEAAVTRALARWTETELHTTRRALTTLADALDGTASARRPGSRRAAPTLRAAGRAPRA